MAAASTSPEGVILNSWKEIASYLGRGVRTVQRYERDLKLPVRRPRGTSRSAVIALVDELEAWLRNAPKNGDFQQKREPVVLVTTVREAIHEGGKLRLRCTELRMAHCGAMTALITTVNTMAGGVTPNPKRNGVGSSASEGANGPRS